MYPSEELLKENQDFQWSQECEASFEILKGKIVEDPILRFPNWLVKFHVLIDTYGVAFGAILTQPGDDGMDYPNAYSSRKLNKVEGNYSTI